MASETLAGEMLAEKVSVCDPGPERAWMSLFYFTTRRHIIPFLAAVIFALASGLTFPLLAIILGRIFNELTNFGAHSIATAQLMDAISVNCIFLFALGLSIWFIQSAYLSLWIAFGELQVKRARDELFKELLAKETKWFDLTTDGVTALLPRIQSHMRDFQLAVSQPLGSVFQGMVASLTGLILALYISWSLTLISLATVPVCAVVISVISMKIQPEIKAQRQELDRASKFSSNAVYSIDIVKVMNGQALEIENYMSAIRAAARHYLKQVRFTAIEIGSIHMLTFGMFVQGFWYGAYLVSVGKLNPGQVLTTFWACLQATQSIENIIPQLLVLEKGRAAATALKDILGHVHPIDGSTGLMSENKTPRFCDGDIKFDNVTFAYPFQPDRLVLNRCSFFFPAGNITFVVGRSGSGKSTLGNLLLRFYAPASGEILIDGVPIHSLDINWIRNNITLVQQQSPLFNESIIRNIAFGAQDPVCVRLDDIVGCVSFAHLKETVQSMPNGLDTVVGLGGDRLSGGQRQRVALARSRLRDTPILIMDESTSALDYYTRIAIMDSLRKWRKGKTTVIITHDLSQIDEQDFVYVVDNGRVSCQGYKTGLDSQHQPIIIPSPKRARIKSSGVGDITSGPVSFVGYPDAQRPSSFLPRPMSPDYSVNNCSRLVFSPVSYSPVFRQSRYHLSSNQPSPSHSLEPSAHFQSSMSHSGEHGTRFTALSPLSKHSEVEQLRYQASISEASPSIHQQGSLFQTLRTVVPSLSKTENILLTLGFIAAFFHAAATPAFAFLFSELLSTFYLTEDRLPAALRYALGILGVSIANGIASFWLHYLLERCGHAWVDRLRHQAISRIVQQPKTWFENCPNNASSLVNCLDRNAEEMRNLVGRFSGFMFVAAVMMVMGTVWGLALCWRLTLVSCACAPVLYALTRVFEKVSGYWEARCNNAAEVVSGIFSETFLDIRNVRSLTLESYFHRKHFLANLETLTIGIKRGCYTGFMFGLSESSIVFVYALVFYYGALLVSSMQYSTKAILTVFSMLLFSMANVKAVLSLVPQISSSRDSATQVLQLAGLPSDRSHEHKGHLRILHPVPIKFTAVNFSYPSQPDKLVLHNFNLTINENTCTAIVGRSGSGKSTIASLLLALYPIKTRRIRHLGQKEGSISLGGLDLREIHVPTLRSLISIVPQRPVIFPISIRENISYGLEESSFYNTLENVRAAAKAAGIDDFISSLPSGYDTIVGDGGVGLSGGQTQRLVIARALIRRPRVLILDEATSSLDVESAAAIKRTVSRLMRVRDGRRGGGLTVVIITHAKEMMQVADRVVVVDKGEVVEEGPFEDLVNKHGGELRRLLRVSECM
ncbi:ABC a-pheromone efflux pump AtrD [Coccidioides immitis RS]|uniref:ABC a-pheromone efflux pump AtrD n=1 Tax=Coccidioides immitis (strain RS) TaxID=246410 RepID=J3K587_COCIM|nr:ABC a-pheromone efflux pump AtrD [Coccidioides immitis RS]EAS29566.3 ABC a-pheromone efflux pump AtrD [Coccidioides immitis RS]